MRVLTLQDEFQLVVVELHLLLLAVCESNCAASHNCFEKEVSETKVVKRWQNP